MSHSEVKLISLVALLLVIGTKVSGHGNGAPSSRCDTMTPGHWISAQTLPSPFQIFVDRENVTEGDRVSITLISADGHDGFKGFLVMVKKPGVESQNYGQFDLNRSDREKSQPLTCFDREGSAMTHVEHSEKRFVHLEWIAPYIDGDEEIFEARGTIVQNFWTIWTNLTALHGIRVRKGSSDNLRRPVEIVKVVHYRDSINSPKSDVTSDDRPTLPELNGSPGIKYSQEEGSWGHFKRSWMQFLQRVGF